MEFAYKLQDMNVTVLCLDIMQLHSYTGVIFLFPCTWTSSYCLLSSYFCIVYG